MDHPEFLRLHRECTESLQHWIAEANRTCEMLGHCLNQPLTLEERSNLHAQRLRENEAQTIHMKNRQKLFEIARSGFGDFELVFGMFPGGNP